MKRINERVVLLMEIRADVSDGIKGIYGQGRQMVNNWVSGAAAWIG